MTQLARVKMTLGDVIAQTSDQSFSMTSGGLATIEQVLRLVAIPVFGTHFEVGAATGSLAVRVALHRPDVRVIGIDPQPDAITSARRLAEDHGATNAMFFEGDARHLPMPSGSCDSVMAGNIPAFVPPEDRAGLIRECARVVTMGGYVVAVPIYYEEGDLPSDEVLDAVDEAIGVKVHRGGLEEWITLYESQGLHLVHRIDMRFTPAPPQRVEEYVWELMDGPLNAHHSPEVREDLARRLIEFYTLFGENNKYARYSILAFQTHGLNVDPGNLLNGVPA